MTDPVPAGQPAPFSGRAAFVISQSYYYVAAAVGVAILLGGGIAALLALREWILPSSDAGFGPDVDGSREAARSFLGALAFVIPGALVFLWHIREARGREDSYRPGAFWGSALYFHLVALIALLIAVGGVIGALHSVRDAVLPACYARPEPLPPVGTPVPGVSPEIEIPIGDVDSPLLEPECFPPGSEALRGALDATIVAAVAGGVWVWHLRRGRRELAAPPAPEPREPPAPPADA